MNAVGEPMRKPWKSITFTVLMSSPNVNSTKNYPHLLSASVFKAPYIMQNDMDDIFAVNILIGVNAEHTQSNYQEHRVTSNSIQAHTFH